MTQRSVLAGLSIALLALQITGCSTLADTRKSEGGGVKQTYQASYDRTWAASVNALVKLRLEVASENKQEGYILAQRGMTAFSYGENVALFLRKQTETATTVEVVSKKAMATNIFAPDWTQDIHSEISKAISK